MATRADGRGRRIRRWQRAAVLVLVALACLAAGACVAAAAIPAPIDLDGTWSTSLVCGAEEFHDTLTVRGWYGYTGNTEHEAEPLEQGRFEDRWDEMGSWEVGGREEGAVVYPAGYGLPRMHLSRAGSTLEMRSAPVEGCGEFVMINTAPQTTPSISGVVEYAPGAPFAYVGVRGAAPGVEGGPEIRAIAHTLADGSYAFWFEPGPDLVEPHVEPKPASDFAVTECSGHAGEGFCGIGLVSGEEATASFLFTQGSEISGTVTEAGGAALAGITLTLTGTTETGESIDQQTISNEQGRYVFGVPTGTYRVTPTQPSEPSLGRILVTSCSGTIVPGACEIALTKSQPKGTANFRRDPLIVNSTGTETNQSEAEQGVCDITPGGGSQTCTLPQAIAVVNASTVGGKSIGFDIPGGGVPQIQDPGGLPAIEKAVVIDGSSQPETGRVELSGSQSLPSVVSRGLILGPGSAGSSVEGMVINGYSDQIDLKGGHDAVEGCLLGTDPSGQREEPSPLGTTYPINGSSEVGILMESSGNQIGGRLPGRGNVLATGYTTLRQSPWKEGTAAILEVRGATGNVIQGNAIGVRAGGAAALLSTPPAGLGEAVTESGLVLYGTDTVGGGGGGNVIAAEAAIGGESVVQANTILGTLYVSGKATVGGATATPGAGLGNSFSFPADDTALEGFGGTAIAIGGGAELVIGGNGAVVQGNRFQEDPSGAIRIDDADNVTVGGSGPQVGNLIRDTATSPDLTEQDHPAAGAIAIVNSRNALIDGNTIEHNGGNAAIAIESGDHDTITDNAMLANPAGIAFGDLNRTGEPFAYNGIHSESPAGPNNWEQYPILLSDSRTAGDISVKLRVNQAGTTKLDLYSQASCSLLAPGGGQGEVFLGAKSVSSHLLDTEFTLRFASSLPAGQDAITVTATDSQGDTSEFSPCLPLDGSAPSLASAGVTPASSTVPVTLPASKAASAAAKRAASKHKRAGARPGRGTITLLCPARAVRYCTGRIVIRVTGRHPAVVASIHFKIRAGLAGRLSFAVASSLLAGLKAGHARAAYATITAHDGGRRPHHKRTRTKLTLRLV